MKKYCKKCDMILYKGILCCHCVRVHDSNPEEFEEMIERSMKDTHCSKCKHRDILKLQSIEPCVKCMADRKANNDPTEFEPRSMFSEPVENVLIEAQKMLEEIDMAYLKMSYALNTDEEVPDIAMKRLGFLNITCELRHLLYNLASQK